MRTAQFDYFKSTTKEALYIDGEEVRTTGPIGGAWVCWEALDVMCEIFKREGFNTKVVTHMGWDFDKDPTTAIEVVEWYELDRAAV